ncbi:methyl-accepting chemotaxis protein [Thalassotalea marina]|uniref:Methyl-accepting chemotaxis protein n=1 Tax=Thalassotalea marina TaxID=1673741 RepID=A0A919BRG6_9GAMM|nr:methyl-accepting chemotaxis protein [Thalassotalea marina]GHG07618.1 methyl-accepting chemotaxis protein [Thalassotalea marina]
MFGAKQSNDEFQKLTAKVEAINRVQAVIEFTLDGTIVDANNNFLSVMGYSLQEVVGKHHSMFTTKEHAASSEYKQFWQKLNKGEFDAGEYKRIAKGGKEVWINASYNPIHDKNGKVVGVIKFATDITQSKRQLANFEGQIKAIGQSQAVIEFELDGTIISANANFLAAMGYSLDEISGKHHRIFAEPEYANSPEYKAFWQQLNQGQFDSGEYKRIGKHGKEVWIQATYNPILDANGKPYKVVKYAVDITERKRAIEEVKDALQLMSEGDLTVKINNNLGSEFQVLKDSINELTTNLNNMFTSVSSAAKNVSHAALELKKGNQDLSSRTESQAASLEETASAMEQLTRTVQENANNAGEAMAKSQSVMGKASEGEGAANDAIQAMQGIEQSSKKISDIISVIDEIAFQTNLLALNAAVEAARAGEQGRGFAVVASEVRNLAQRSASAAREIKGLIKDSVAAVNQGSQLVDNTGQTLNALIGAVEEVVFMVAQIDTASKEQAVGINEVSGAVSQMDEMTQQNAALVEEATAASLSLENNASLLLEQLTLFKIEQSNNVKGSSTLIDKVSNEPRSSIMEASDWQ